MTVPDTLTTMGTQTLSQRLGEGRLPVGDALRYAMMLAESLRRMHDAGEVHGGVSPSAILVTDSGLELTPEVPPGQVTPYTAPEVVSGRPAEAVSDIFSYGAVLYEMLTGRKAFDGATPAELAASIVDSQPVSTGSPAVDRLLASCLAKDPTARCQRVQKVILELKLLGVAARKAEAPRRESAEAKQEKTAEALNTVQSQVGAFQEQLAAAQERSSRAEQAIQSLQEHVGSHLAPNLESFAGRFSQLEQGLTGIWGRLDILEQAETVAALQNQIAAFSGQLTATHERSARAEQEIQSLNEHIGTRLVPNLEAFALRFTQLEQSFAAVSNRLGGLEEKVNVFTTQTEHASAEAAEHFTRLERTVSSLRDRVIHVDDQIPAMAARVQQLEAGLDASKLQTAELRERVTADIMDVVTQLKDHAAAIESSRTAAAQTDDLVERVVEALEALQSSILEQPEGEAPDADSGGR